jgi:uncharacterized HAD superfamily protein
MQEAIICDLDGTLALLGKRSPYDYQRVGSDRLNVAVALVVRAMHRQGYAVLLFTGRESSSEEKTRAWLEKHTIPYDVLVMRAAGDNRKDAIVKREMYQRTVAGVYSVAFVLDDRNQVVDMWRKDLGLPCFQVNYGNF